MKKRICCLSMLLVVGFLFISAQPAMAKNGACILQAIGSSYRLPGNYTASEVGPGYVMKKLGPVDNIVEVGQRCTDTIFQQMMPQYCQNNGSLASKFVALFDSNDNLIEHNYSPNVSTSISCTDPTATSFTGACLVKMYGPSPNYTAPEVGTYYMMKKIGVVPTPTVLPGGQLNTLAAENYVFQKCPTSTFDEFTSTLCGKYPAYKDKVVWDFAIFDSGGRWLGGGISEHACPPDLTVLGIVNQSSAPSVAGSNLGIAINKVPTVVKVKVKNIGMSSAPAAEVILQANLAGAAKLLAKGTSKPFLAPGEEQTIDLSPTGEKVTAADCLGRDVIKIEAVIDPKNLIQELSNSNNSFMVQIDCSEKIGPQIKPKLPIKK